MKDMVNMYDVNKHFRSITKHYIKHYRLKRKFACHRLEYFYQFANELTYEEIIKADGHVACLMSLELLTKKPVKYYKTKKKIGIMSTMHSIVIHIQKIIDINVEELDDQEITAQIADRINETIVSQYGSG